MTAVTMFDDRERADVYRWTMSALLVTALHGLVVIGWSLWPEPPQPLGAHLPPAIIELSLVSVSPQETELDLAPGPVMQESDSATTAAKPAAAEEAFAPVLPPMDSDLVLPAAQPKAEKAPVTEQEPVKSEAEKEAPQTRKPVEKKKTHTDRTPAPKTTASRRAEQRAHQAASSRVGAQAMANALPSYRERLAAHLQRYKRYPPELRAAGVRGVARLTFTVNRSGHVLSSRLTGSSGNSSLDAETLAMIRRAQPLPSFPPEITVSSMSFTIPVGFVIR